MEVEVKTNIRKSSVCVCVAGMLGDRHYNGCHKKENK